MNVPPRRSPFSTLVVCRLLVALACVVFAGCQGTQPPPAAPPQKPGTGGDVVIMNTFDTLGKAEAWHSYDYDAGVEAGRDTFFPVTHEATGGAFNSGYIWTDDSRWRIDSPEQPNSILALIYYRDWVGGPRLDLRNAQVSLFLRGDGLDLKGAKVHFWAHIRNNRWHYTGHPLTITMDKWGSQQSFVLKNDESLWTRTWASREPASLDRVLRESESYGISFIGFSGEATGKLAMDHLTIRAKISDMR